MLKTIIQWITSGFQEWWKYQKDMQEVRRDGKRINQAKKLAKIKANKYGRRYYVLRDWNGHPKAINSSEVQTLKRLGVMSKRVTINDLLKESLFHTK